MSSTTTMQVKKFVKMASTGVVRLEGPDGLDLLHRISTNDLSKLGDGDYRHTILTTEKGKIVDIVAVWRRTSTDLLLVSWSGQPSAVRAWIEKFIIMEHASVKEESGFSQYAEFGGEMGRLEETSEWISFDTAIGGRGFRNHICPTQSEKDLRRSFGKHGVHEADVDDFEDFCIRMGLPQWPHEISAEVNPLEAGLESLISWTKGCYVGQEVIARLDTYKKVQKHLVSFELDARPPSLPVPLESNKATVGTLTRVTRQAPFVGLGYVGTDYESASLRTGGQTPIALRKRS